MTPNLDRSVEAYTEKFTYALDNRLILTWYPHRVIAKARGTSMLELGIGFGYSMKIFAGHFSRYLVIEGSQEVIRNALAARSLSDVNVCHAYFETFETEEAFDNINMGFVLEHVDDPSFILSRFKKFLGPNGRIFISVPNAEALNRRYGHAAGLLPDMLQLGEADRLLGHRRAFTVKTLRDLVESEGFVVHSAEGLFLKPITTGQINQLALSEEILQAMMKVGVDYPELSVGMLFEVSCRE